MSTFLEKGRSGDRGAMPRDIPASGVRRFLLRSVAVAPLLAAGIAGATSALAASEAELQAQINAMKADIGTTGPTILQGRVERTRSLAPYVALAALLPLLLIILRPVPRGLATALLVFSRESLTQALRLRAE